MSTLSSTKNTLEEQLKYLTDRSIKGEQLKEEIARAKVVRDISSTILGIYELGVEAAKLASNTEDLNLAKPLLELSSIKDE